LNSESIVAKLIERYQGLKTYQNSGFVQVTCDQSVSKSRFRTCFQRPSNYRFDWWSEFEHNSYPLSEPFHGQLWSNTKGAFIRYGNDAYKKRRNLKAALSSGFPHSEAAILPMSLLLPEVVQFDSCISLMKDGVLKPKPSFMPFHQVFFQKSVNETLDLYIHEDDFSLRRVRRVTSYQFTQESLDSIENAPDSDAVVVPKATLLADMKLLLNQVHRSTEDFVFEEQFFDQRIFGNPFSSLPIERK